MQNVFPFYELDNNVIIIIVTILLTLTLQLTLCCVVLTEGQEEADGQEVGVRLWGGPDPPPPSAQCGGAPRQKGRSQGGDS